jgi:DNA-binding CsgD family transcriptional regulator
MCGGRASTVRGVDAQANDLQRLSEREAQVMLLVTEGMTNRQIAERLGVTVHAVKFHLASIYRKLEAKNRTEAVVTFLTRSDTRTTTR